MSAGPGQEVVSLKETGGGHWTRNIVFDRKGEKMYVAVGSGSNVNAGEAAIRAAVHRYNPDGTGHEIFVSGTRTFRQGANLLDALVKHVPGLLTQNLSEQRAQSSNVVSQGFG